MDATTETENVVTTEPSCPVPEQPPVNTPAPLVVEEEPKGIEAIIKALQQAINSKDDDIDQTNLVKVIQDNRAFILQYAMKAYLENPKNGSLLEGVTAIIAQIEKTVRDDRKERMKKKENETSQVAFSQMIEALKGISSGSFVIPVFEQAEFILDPSKSLLDLANVKPIKPEELEQGNKLVDIDGNPI